MSVCITLCQRSVTEYGASVVYYIRSRLQYPSLDLIGPSRAEVLTSPENQRIPTGSRSGLCYSRLQCTGQPVHIVPFQAIQVPACAGPRDLLKISTGLIHLQPSDSNASQLIPSLPDQQQMTARIKSLVMFSKTSISLLNPIYYVHFIVLLVQALVISQYLSKLSRNLHHMHILKSLPYSWYCP